MSGIEFMTDYEDIQKGWSLYRLYDAENRLLYIGCSRDVYSRVYSHECASSSMLDAAVIQRHATRCYVTFASTVRREALAAEAHAITTERPLLNRQHNYTRWATAGRDFVPADEETRRQVEHLRGTEPVAVDALVLAQRERQEERMHEAMRTFGSFMASIHAASP